jgi:hypothetical protein
MIMYKTLIACALCAGFSFAQAQEVPVDLNVHSGDKLTPAQQQVLDGINAQVAIATHPDAVPCPFGHEEECDAIQGRMAVNDIRVQAARQTLQTDYERAGPTPNAFYSAKITEDSAKLSALVGQQ